MDNLDQAALRRFDIKISFDYLSQEQSFNLFKQHCKHLNIKKQLKAIKSTSFPSNLTPGDFAMIARKQRFSPIATAIEFLQSLVDECNLKGDNNRSIGFI